MIQCCVHHEMPEIADSLALGANLGFIPTFKKAGFAEAARVRDCWRLDDGGTYQVLYEAVAEARPTP